MTVTLKRNWGRSAAHGDFQAMCDYCGVMWPRSRLYRDGSGLLVCPHEGLGKDLVTLSEENARAASEDRMIRPIGDGGNFDPVWLPEFDAGVTPQDTFGDKLLFWNEGNIDTRKEGVAGWRDRSERRNHWVAPSGDSPLLAKGAGKDGGDAIDFSNVSRLIGPSLNGLRGGAIWARIKVDSPIPDDKNTLWYIQDSNFIQSYPWSDGNFYETTGTNTSIATGIQPGNTIHEWHTYCVVSEPGDYRVFVNGVLGYSNSGITSIWSRPPRSVPHIQLGRINSNNYFKGKMDRFIMCMDAPTEEQRSWVEAYLL